MYQLMMTFFFSSLDITRLSGQNQDVPLLSLVPYNPSGRIASPMSEFVLHHILSEGLVNLYSVNSLVTMIFNCIIIIIIIIFVGLLNPFSVCITIYKIPDFLVWNYSPFILELLSLPFIYFL